jgi:uncharacterized linocin/CFP29 family protein
MSAIAAPPSYILNGAGFGDVASRLMSSGMDPRVLRPWIGKDGRSQYITQNDEHGKPYSQPVMNTGALLRKDDWLALDQAIVKAATPRLKLVADLRSAGLQYNIPNGLGKTVLDTEKVSDINDADMSMDGLRESLGDRPVFDLASLPLPIIHKDYHFSARQVMCSRNGGSPLDTTMAELAARKVAEYAEKLAIGSQTGITFGNGTIYGITNMSGRMTKTVTSPTATGWTPATLVNEVLEMRYQAQAAYHYGPYMLYFSLDWDVYLDDDYSAAKGDLTLRERLAMIEGIQGVRTLDYLPVKTCVLLQMTSDVIREVIGMDITTVQWESKGGMQLNFKVMAIMVPQLRSDYNSRTGIVHGSYT